MGASAIKQLAPKLDGSCCAELPGGDQQRCVAQIKHRGETLVRDYEALCTGSEFVESVLGRLPLAFEETDEPTATFVETSSMSVWQAAACASVAGAVGAAAAVYCTSCRAQAGGFAGELNGAASHSLEVRCKRYDD